MTHAAVTGWGKCLPPAVLTNADLATFLDTDDEWIVSRTGMRERRVTHVPLGELIRVAGARALACAGLPAERLDLVLVGSTIGDELAPNVASGVQRALGKNMSVEARLIHTTSFDNWTLRNLAGALNYNEINIVENKFLNEFRLAQANLVANIAAGRSSAGFAYTGVPGTSPRSSWRT